MVQGIFDSINQDKGFLYGLIGSSIGYARSKSMQANAYNYARALQQQQYDLQQQALREGYTNARQGLESAGLNPILASSNGFGSNFGTISGGTPVSAPSYGDDLGFGGTASANAYQTYKLNKQSVNNQSLTSIATAEQSNAQAELAKEQAITEQAKRTQMEFQNAMYDVEKHLKQKELSWADRKFYSEIYDNMQRAENYGAMASIARYNAVTERQNAQTNAMNANTSEYNAYTNRWGTIKGRQIENARYELDKIKAPFSMSRDVGIGIGSLMHGSGINSVSHTAKNLYPPSQHISAPIRTLHTFGRTRTYK